METCDRDSPIGHTPSCSRLFIRFVTAHYVNLTMYVDLNHLITVTNRSQIAYKEPCERPS